MRALRRIVLILAMVFFVSGGCKVGEQSHRYINETYYRVDTTYTSRGDTTVTVSRTQEKKERKFHLKWYEVTLIAILVAIGALLATGK